ncbi:TonB family protein [Mucilaginibacter sp. X4EP1]|uniref:energy transducer TonB n=1 Tax=Mucilaginibacter sp. X4EP1 TaxID=2723092 RepID=UPI002166D71B|nr:energy transducer TonB [Mucilaginibacter sp. X4EP1]MCS3814825.1 TonB family protein [Mucilaginibacter sp. X4EP1]
MIKSLLTLILSACFFLSFAQKKDTSVYYVAKSGKMVSTRDSADYFLLVLPMDDKLSTIKEYYKNGAIKLIGNATITGLKFQGAVISFFPNGHKMSIKNYDTGSPTGDLIEYYPNGKFYNKKSYTDEIIESDRELLYKDCNDSTGSVLAENGNGKWIKFDNDFTKVLEKGNIIDGKRDGVWTIAVTDSTGFMDNYRNGALISSQKCFIVNNKFFASVTVNTPPAFPGGIEALYKFLSKNLRYPSKARGNNTQGRVIVNFIVEKDGTLSDMKVIHGIGDGCDEEAVRIMKLSPPWTPAIQNGKPVRVSYTVPIGFQLAN